MPNFEGMSFLQEAFDFRLKEILRHRKMGSTSTCTSSDNDAKV
jgi:hypothetical protein